MARRRSIVGAPQAMPVGLDGTPLAPSGPAWRPGRPARDGDSLSDPRTGEHFVQRGFAGVNHRNDPHAALHGRGAQSR